MACQSCGKKHPLNRTNQAARHFTNMPRRVFGKPPAPPVAKVEEVPLPPQDTVIPEEGGEGNTIK